MLRWAPGWISAQVARLGALQFARARRRLLKIALPEGESAERRGTDLMLR